MSRGPDAATQLQRALLAAAESAGCAVRVAASEWDRWASATFSGARHLLTLEAAGSPALDTWLAGLPEAEFALQGNLVADLVVESARCEGDRVAFVLEVLTIEER